MNMKYTDDHEWARPDGDLLVVGITDFAQQQLGEVVFVELPEVDREVDQGEDTAVVESVKAAGEVKSPVSGTIVEVNETLADTPEKVNEDPTGEGWFYKLRPSDPGQLEAMLDQEAYQTLVESLA
jgi:glycine cleavage system H protein